MANDNNNELTYFGVLMHRKLIDNSIYLFKPEYLIEGNIESENKRTYFTDTMANEYLTIHDTEILSSDEETAVGYIISDDELTRKYPDLSIPEAKIKYFDSIRDLAHVGFYLAKDDKIIVMPLNLMAIAQKLASMDLDPTLNVIEMPTDPIKQPDMSENDDSKDKLNDAIDEFGGQELVVMSSEIFKDLIESKTFEEMKIKLDKIKAEYEKMKPYFVDEAGQIKEPKKIDTEIFFETKVTGQHILDLFNASYDAILAMDDTEELKRTIAQVVGVYTALSLVIDEQGTGGYDIEAVEDHIYTLVDKYEELQDLDDLSLIKEGIVDIKKSEFKNIKAISNIYDELNEKKESNNETGLMEIKQSREEKQAELDAAFKEEKKIGTSFDYAKVYNQMIERIIGRDKQIGSILTSIDKMDFSIGTGKKYAVLIAGTT